MFIEEDVGDAPYAFIQWKNTDVCLDFQCPCGEGGHFDGYFAYSVKCQYCGKEWELPCNLIARPNQREWTKPVLLEKEDE